jgi:hypothetical protein
MREIIWNYYGESIAFVEWAFRASLFCRDYISAPWEI